MARTVILTVAVELTIETPPTELKQTRQDAIAAADVVLERLRPVIDVEPLALRTEHAHGGWRVLHVYPHAPTF